MQGGTPTRGRRILLVGLAVAFAGLAALLAATVKVGSRVWPSDENTVARRLGTDAAVIETALAKRPPGTDIRIGVIGDIQNGITELADLLDSFREERVDFLLQLGDAANEGEPARYAVLRHVFEEHAPGIPVIAVPGNHDIEPDSTTTVWTEWVGPPEWRIDAGGWRILGLDDADATVSPASMELLRRAAADGPARCGTILVAHRPLGAGEPKEGVEARARQIATTGVRATLTFSGHWHVNDAFTDTAGTVHHLLGENCDRSSRGPNLPVSHAVLTLSGVDQGCRHELSVTTIPRRTSLEGEFLRLAVAHVYPSLRGHPGLAWVGVLALLAAAGLSLLTAFRRTHRAVA